MPTILATAIGLSGALLGALLITITVDQRCVRDGRYICKVSR